MKALLLSEEFSKMEEKLEKKKIIISNLKQKNKSLINEVIIIYI